jgi:predicted permease
MKLFMNTLLQDIRSALRQLRKSPGFTVIAVVTLALGIGANTGIFTLVNAVLLKSLPVPNPEQIFVLRQTDRLAENTRVSYPVFQRMRDAVPASASIAAMGWPFGAFVSLGGEQPERVNGQLVSGNYFHTLETYPALGRLLDREDDQVAGGRAVAVISYRYWERHFGRDPSIIGRKLVVNGVPCTITGIAAREFFGTRVGAAPDFWLPTMMQHDVHYSEHYSSNGGDPSHSWASQESVRWVQTIVRVKDPQEYQQITAALNQVFHQDLERDAPKVADPQERQEFLRQRVELESASRGLATLRRQFSRPLLVLMGMVGMVLLIACANIANLLLARATAREREIAVRLSMGATRGRLVRQLLTECGVLSLFGAALGAAVALWCSSVLPRWASAQSTPVPLNLAPDVRVLLFTSTIAIVTGILFGLAPAIRGTHVEVVAALKANARGFSDRGHHGRGWSLRQILVASQMALSLLLLIGSGLFIRTLRNFGQLDPGFERDHLLSVELDTHVRNYTKTEMSAVYAQLVQRVQAVPGVRSATLSTCGLAAGCLDASDIYFAGSARLSATPQVYRVSLGYFVNIGVRLREGRDFITTDNEKSPKVAIVNQTFVHRFLRGQQVLGARFGYQSGPAHDREFEIVGVVDDARVNDIREGAPPMVYMPLAQGIGNVESLDVRTAADPAWLAGQVRQVVKEVDPDLPVVRLSTLSTQLENNLAQPRLIARLTTIFGALALGLACLGLYGVMSYTVARRTSELGIRMALGSTRGGILRMVLRETLSVIAVAILGGVLLSLASTRAVNSLIFGLSPHDPVTFAATSAVLFAVSLTAGLVPAWRATQVDPMVALRYE